jgi:hypothetical protein
MPNSWLSWGSLKLFVQDGLKPLFFHLCLLSSAGGSHLNPSYSGGKHQEDLNLKSAGQIALRDPILKKPITKKRAGGVAQGEGPELKPQYRVRNVDFSGKSVLEVNREFQQRNNKRQFLC